MSGPPPTTTGSPNLNSTARERDIQLSIISNSNGSSPDTNVGDHYYDDLLQGPSSATSTSASTAIGLPEKYNPSSYGVPSQDNYNFSNYNYSSNTINNSNNNYNTYSNNNTNINNNNNNSGTNGTTGQQSLARKVTLTGGSTGVSEIKLKRFLEHNKRLREQYEMRRVPVSEACNSLLQYVKTTYDPLLPIVWGVGPDPFAKQSSKCCAIL